MGMLRAMFYNIDPNTVVLGLLFIIFLVVINYALMRFFKKDKTTPTIISLCVSLLAVYGLSRTNLDLSGFFYGIGISQEAFYIIAPIIILAGLALLFWKAGFSRTLILLGILLIVLGFTPLIYEKTTIIVIGIVLLALGIIFWFIRKKRKGKESENKPHVQRVKNLKKPKNKFALPVILVILGVAALIAGAALNSSVATWTIFGIVLIVLGIIVIPLLRFTGLSGGI